VRVALVAALLLVAPALHAQDQGRPAPAPPAAKAPPPPLSAEDAEVARELALLEKLELLKNLELFEPEPAPPAKTNK
jgi:hypothetical protein